jgi:cell division protein FtsB
MRHADDAAPTTRMMKRRVRAALLPLLFLTLAAWFAWQSTQGDRGLWAIAAREQLLAESRAELARAEAERLAWERRVASLRGPAGIDRDLLDERSRAVLNLADPREVVVPWQPGQRPN